MEGARFATAINCMDGRVQIPVNEWIKSHLEVNYVDTITEPGVDKIITEGPQDLIESIKNRIKISITAHHSKAIAIVGHYDCAGNPVSDEKHFEQIKHAVDIIKSWGFTDNVIGLWLNELWWVEVVK